MKIVSLYAFVTGVCFVFCGWPIPSGIAFTIAVVFFLASLGDDNTWHRH